MSGNRIITPPGFGGQDDQPKKIKTMQQRLDDVQRYWESNPRKAATELLGAMHFLSNLCAHYAKTIEGMESRIRMLSERVDDLESK